MKFKKGDIVVGLQSANEQYLITRWNTQWMVYDIEHENVLLAKTVPLEKYQSLKKVYDYAEDKELARRALRAHWVEARHFDLVFSRKVEDNEDALKFLQDDKELAR